MSLFDGRGDDASQLSTLSKIVRSKGGDVYLSRLSGCLSFEDDGRTNSSTSTLSTTRARKEAPRDYRKDPPSDSC